VLALAGVSHRVFGAGQYGDGQNIENWQSVSSAKCRISEKAIIGI
jgi:hypothetical protein